MLINKIVATCVSEIFIKFLIIGLWFRVFFLLMPRSGNTLGIYSFLKVAGGVVGKLLCDKFCAGAARELLD